MSKTLGDFLREKRTQAGLSQLDVANKLGYTSQFISNWERDLSQPPLPALKVLIKIYKMSKKDVIDRLLASYKAKITQEL